MRFAVAIAVVLLLHASQNRVFAEFVVPDTAPSHDNGAADGMLAGGGASRGATLVDAPEEATLLADLFKSSKTLRVPLTRQRKIQVDRAVAMADFCGPSTGCILRANHIRMQV
jgi:hypothetical protein